MQDVPDQTHGMKRHTQFQSPTTSIRLETPISKNINLPKMEKVADDLETWRTRSNEKRGEYDAPIARMEARNRIEPADGISGIRDASP